MPVCNVVSYTVNRQLEVYGQTQVECMHGTRIRTRYDYMATVVATAS